MPQPKPAGDRFGTLRPIAAGLLGGGLAILIRVAVAHWHFANDFDQLWVAARALVQGDDPYTAVARARLNLGYPLYYPLPAVVLVLPLAALPLAAARIAFAGICGFLAGYGLSRSGAHRLLALASVPFLASVLAGQLASALTGAALIPALGFLLPAKPTVGLALWGAYPSRRSAVLAVGCIGLTVLLWPWWPEAWFQAIRASPHIRAPLLRPGGALLLLAAFRWRQPGGRLLALWACIPRTEGLYDLLPLFLVTRTASETALLTVLSWLALFTEAVLPGASNPITDPVRATATTWLVLLTLLYLPALALVLRRPPSTEASPTGKAEEAEGASRGD